ncbi:MAG TPA: cyclodeaminase/cyclohydrolase family protein [Phycisphaerae bacterium]|jgi:formiminotetrahydrofolate cyclodeaminase
MSTAGKSEMESTLAGFLDRLAAKSPTPGGGGAAALSGAVGCALARMVAGYSAGKSRIGLGGHGDAAVEERLAALLPALERADHMLRQFVDEDAAAYLELVAARRTAKQDPAQQPAYQQAVRLAAAVPLEIAAVASGALDELDASKSLISKYFMSDLGAVAAILHGAVQAAACSVRVNLPEISDLTERNRIMEQLVAVLTHATQRAAAVADFVAHRM